MAGQFLRILRVGKLPADVRAEVESEAVIHLSERIGVFSMFAGQVPGRRSSGVIRGYSGALVLTEQRVLATLCGLAGRASRAVDQLWTAGQSGAVTGSLSESGLLLHVNNLSTVDPQFSGTLSLAFRTRLCADALWRLPARTIAFDVSPMFVYGVLGVSRG